MAREQATSLTEDDDIQDGEEELVIIEQEPETDEGSYEDIPQKANSDDDERDSIRERRRAEKQERKERREQAIKRDKLELDFLRKRNDDLERRLSAQEQKSFHQDLGSLDVQINQAAKEAEMAERVIAKAVEAGNGADVTQAMRYRDQAIAKIQQLNFAKQQAQQVAVQRQQVPQIDDLTMHYANEFIKENPWYDTQGRDEDSAIVLAIDQALSKDGYDPKTEDYWDELRRRAARRLPDKFGNERQARQPRGGPAVGSGREHAPASTKKDVYISPERKQALIDAGVWEDPVLRMKYVKRYAEYDRNRRS